MRQRIYSQLEEEAEQGREFSYMKATERRVFQKLTKMRRLGDDITEYDVCFFQSIYTRLGLVRPRLSSKPDPSKVKAMLKDLIYHEISMDVHFMTSPKYSL